MLLLNQYSRGFMSIVRLICFSWIGMVMSQAAPVAFKEPVELTESILIDNPVQIDADGNGSLDLTGYDARLKKLVSSLSQSAQMRSIYPKGRMIHEGELSDVRSKVFQYDIDGDGYVDVTLQDGNKMVWWKQLPGQGIAWRGAWATVMNDRNVCAVADMDQDGNADVIFSSQQDEMVYIDIVTYSAMVGYGDGNGNFSWMKIPNAGVSYENYKPVDIDGDGDLDWPSGDDQIILFQGRSIAAIVSLPEKDPRTRYSFANIDGGEGVELIGIDGFSINDSSPGRIRVWRLSGTDWQPLGSFVKPPWFDAFESESAFIGIVCGQFHSNRPSSICLVYEKMIFEVGWIDDELSIDSYAQLTSNLPPYGFVQALPSPNGSYDSLFLHSYSERRELLMGSFFFSGTSQWINIPLTDINSTPVYSVWNHDSRVLTSIEIEGNRRIASIGKSDGALQVWRAPTGSASRRTLFLSGDMGVGLVAGKFRGQQNPEELAFLNSPVDSGVKFDPVYSYSKISVGRPYLSDGSGLNWYRSQMVSGYLPNALLGKADFDADGIDDLLYVDASDGNMVWRSGFDPGSHALTPKMGEQRHEVGFAPILANGAVTGMQSRNVSILDVDGDGDSDILQYPSVLGNTVAVFENRGNGTFTVRRLLDTSSEISPQNDERSVSIYFGNFDGVGLPDVAFITTRSEIIGNDYGVASRIYLVKGGEATVSEVCLVRGGLTHVAIGDFNGDGLDDLAYSDGYERDQIGNMIYPEGTSILLRKDASSFYPPVLISDQLNLCSSLHAADINGDGKADLIHGCSEDGTVYYIESTSFSPMPTYEDWAIAHQVTDGSQDHDGDGATNFYEYLTGRDPNQAEPAKDSSGGPGEAPVIRFSKNLNYQPGEVFDLHAVHAVPAQLPNGTEHVVLEKSSDLINWDPVNATPKAVMAVGHPGWEIHTWNMTVSSSANAEPNYFYRLRAWVE